MEFPNLKKSYHWAVLEIRHCLGRKVVQERRSLRRPTISDPFRTSSPWFKFWVPGKMVSYPINSENRYNIAQMNEDVLKFKLLS